MSIVYHDNTGYEIDDELSQRDFTGQDLRGRFIPPGSIIYRSCFQQHDPDTVVFAEPLKGVTFLFCNLNNVYIPEGNSVIEGTHLRHKTQKDGLDWIIDEYDNPIRLLNEKHHRLTKMRELEEAGLAVTYPPMPEVPKQNWFIRVSKTLWRKLWR